MKRINRILRRWFGVELLRTAELDDLDRYLIAAENRLNSDPVSSNRVIAYASVATCRIELHHARTWFVPEGSEEMGEEPEGSEAPDE